MKIFIERNLASARVSVWFFQHLGDRRVAVSQPEQPLRMGEALDNSVAQLKEQPTWRMEEAELVELHASLGDELRRCGAIAPSPSEDTIRELRARVASLEVANDRLITVADSAAARPVVVHIDAAGKAPVKLSGVEQ